MQWGGQAAKKLAEMWCGSYCQAVSLQGPTGKRKEKLSSEIIGRMYLSNGMDENSSIKTILKREAPVGMCETDVRFLSASMLI